MRSLAGIALGALALAIGTACTGVGPFAPNGNGGLTISTVTPIMGAIGETQQLQLMVGDGQPISGPITWSSSNGGVATVDATGLVTAVGDGSTTITGSSNGLSGTTVLTVAARVVFTATVTGAGQTDGNAANNVGSAAITITIP